MADLTHRLAEIVGADHVLPGDAISADYAHDEALTSEPVMPGYVVRPASAAQVASVLTAAAETGTPVTARGSGSGLSGSAAPRAVRAPVPLRRPDKGPALEPCKPRPGLQPRGQV